MIDICQWRVSIGLWYPHQVSYTANTTSVPVGWTLSNCSTVHLTISLVVFLLLLLILSGDVELNPGPKTGNT